MDAKITIRQSLLIVLCLLFSTFLAWAQDLQDGDQIAEAIRICREKLAVDPHFPKVQYSLAQLLDSQIIVEQDELDHELVTEVIDLYYTVGWPSQETLEDRLPPVKVRFDALVRAATIADEILQDTDTAVQLFIEALHLDGVDTESTIAAFAVVMPMILSSVLEGREDTARTIAPDGSIQTEPSFSSHDQLQQALYLCDYVCVNCPNESIVDEYKGATLRKMKEPLLAFKSYEVALFKAREAYRQCNRDLNDCAPFLASYIKTSILVSAAAREADVGPDEQMEYLREVEAHVGPFTNERFFEDLDDATLESGRNQVVDLYNNMGIIEKKRGSLGEAKNHFLKALEFNPNDGHAVVQLASLEDDAIANVKDLDQNYVRDLFDGYSPRFESELVDVLQYQGHTLVYEALEKAWMKAGIHITSGPTMKIIDLGCGTGLLGELIAHHLVPEVAEVHGVDLSQRMVDIATARKTNKGHDVYVTVTNADATEYLSNQANESVDAILASDVFIYIGDIGQVLEESAKKLMKGGLVGFTVESYETKSKSDDGGLKLLPSGRFGHSKSYISNVAKAHGFDVIVWQKCVLRQGGGKDVNGAVAILRKEKK
ncbi:unnamed protein product [Cylindrotheca closterium]|uniref:Methyltransferase domain-containing protein n=1 Tax=Cylindrotheca closterium TaxID=2856 RepID=A0AAD2FMA6_9STRA|nr:unnamed protein product [Cylindrotheca closterium]